MPSVFARRAYAMHTPIRTYACGSRFASRIVYRALRAQYRVHVGGCLRRVLRIVRHAVLNVQFAVGATVRARVAYRVSRIAYPRLE